MRCKRKLGIAIAVIGLMSAIGVFAVAGKCSDSAFAPTSPAGVFDLKNWKLAIPVNTNHPGDPDEIKQPELEDYQSQYFKLSSAKNGVVFMANAGGEVISGSDFPRTELREMTNLGANLAAWTSADSTHTMIIEESVTHLPTSHPSIIVGQIHDADDYVLLIRLDGSRLFVKVDDRAVAVLDDNYELGDTFELKIQASGSSIGVYYNGVQEYVLNRQCNGCYFKAGIYLQTNIQKGDSAESYGEVLVTGLSITES